MGRSWRLVKVRAGPAAMDRKPDPSPAGGGRTSAAPMLSKLGFLEVDMRLRFAGTAIRSHTCEGGSC